MELYSSYSPIFKIVILIFVLLIRPSVENDTNGVGQRPKHNSNQKQTKYMENNKVRNMPMFGQGQICPRNSPSDCRCWARPDMPSQITFVNCTGTNKDVVPQDAHPSVEIFILDHNRIKRIESYLGAYVRLTTLSIKNNDISSISVGSFASTPLLRDLDLSKNKLSQVTRTMFSGLKLLQTLSLRENYIESIQDNSFLMDKNRGCCSLLRELDLSNNKLATLSDATFNGLYNLETLDLRGNTFRQVPTIGLKPLKKLDILDLSNNPELQKIPNSAFSHNKGLVTLRLQGCRLTSIDSGAFSSLESLRELDISGNHLQAIPGNSFRPLIHLETLRIGNNQIFEITYADFRSLENLESFLMDGCYRDRDLRIASDAFKENAKLREISITKCEGLQEIKDDTFRYLTDLRILNLHGNGIHSIGREAIDFSSIEWIDLSGNRFHCSCEMEPWLSEIHKIRQKQISTIHGPIPTVYCSTPASLAGTPIGKLTSEDLDCEDEDRMSSVAIGLTAAGSVIAFILLLLILFYFFKKSFYGRNQQTTKTNFQSSTATPQVPSNIYCCFGGDGRPKPRKGRVKRPSQQHILKKDITVETIPLNSTQLPQGWKDVEVSVEQLSDEGIYECMPDDLERPIGPPNANYPDVKLSIISTTL